MPRKSATIAALSAQGEQLPLVKPITSVELLALETTRDSLRLLSKTLEDAKDQLKAQEGELMQRLEAGAQVLGPMAAHVHSEPGDCRPKWKDLMLAHMAKYHNVTAVIAEAKVREGTPRPTVKSLVISRRSDVIVP